MTRLRKTTIDLTLAERHTLVTLLDRLGRQDLTVGELDDIGEQLCQAGTAGLRPVLRRLWQERDPDLLSRYAYLLESFDESLWMNQLVAVVLRRKDLEPEGRAALLATLEHYGADLTAPPFDAMARLLPLQLAENLSRLLDRGEEGYIRFLDELLHADADQARMIVRTLPQRAGIHLFPFLELLLTVDSPAIVEESIRVLGECRRVEAATLLKSFLTQTDDEKELQLSERALRRLAFLGISPTFSASAPLPQQFEGMAGVIDSRGYRSLLVSSCQGGDEYDLLCLQISDSAGVSDAFGYRALTGDRYRDILHDMVEGEGLVTVPFSYLLQLLRDALYHNQEAGQPLPVDFLVWRRLLRGHELRPVPHIPSFAEQEHAGMASAPHLLATSDRLLEDEFFDGFFLGDSRVYDYAETLLPEVSSDDRPQGVVSETLLATFCRELIVPELPALARRLVFTAELMVQGGRPRRLVDQTLAVASSLTNAKQMIAHRHPFLRRLAFESLQMAWEALRLGEGRPQEWEHPSEEW
ncbi:MAG TPA: hypothetical protein VFR01_04190 [Geobacterales bacterium]|nr:hypothetical protein [Geobacterales bacterium]